MFPHNSVIPSEADFIPQLCHPERSGFIPQLCHPERSAAQSKDLRFLRVGDSLQIRYELKPAGTSRGARRSIPIESSAPDFNLTTFPRKAYGRATINSVPILFPISFEGKFGGSMLHRFLYAVGRKLTALCIVTTIVMPMQGIAYAACPTSVNTSVQLSTGFENQSLSPFSLCTYKSPNYGQIESQFAANGRYAYQFFWQQAGYDGTRDARGVEACGDLQTYKEGWYGFEFYLPSSGYPKNKTAAIAQIFQNGYCNSWGALLVVENGALNLNWRDYCGTANVTPIAANIQYDAWNPIVIHWIASHENAGTLQVWYGRDACPFCQNNPTFTATNINFGFAQGWVGDTLPSGSGEALKFGMYNFDDGNYTVGETRTLYYDCVNQLVGSPSNQYAAFNMVNPNMW
jgi:hypothetical protein